VKELHVDGRLFLVVDGDRLLEPSGDYGPDPSDRTLRETGHRSDAAQCFTAQVNHARDTGCRVEVRDRSWS
jgi:hypothetical protein